MKNKSVKFSDLYEYALEVGSKNSSLLISLCSELVQYLHAKKGADETVPEAYKTLYVPVDIALEIFSKNGVSEIPYCS